MKHGKNAYLAKQICLAGTTHCLNLVSILFYTVCLFFELFTLVFVCICRGTKDNFFPPEGNRQFAGFRETFHRKKTVLVGRCKSLYRTQVRHIEYPEPACGC